MLTMKQNVPIWVYVTEWLESVRAVQDSQVTPVSAKYALGGLHAMVWGNVNPWTIMHRTKTRDLVLLFIRRLVRTIYQIIRKSYFFLCLTIFCLLVSCLCISLFIYLSIYLSLYLPTCPSTNLCICLSMSQSFCLSACLWKSLFDDTLENTESYHQWKILV